MYQGSKNIFKQAVLCAGVFVAVFIHAHSADAALLYFDPGAAEVYRGDTVSLGLRIDTDEGECINTVDAVIHYDPSIRAVDISRGDSILNLWVEDPIIDEINHTIRFAGGIPGGYCGRIPGDPSLTNVLLELVFRSPGLSIGGGDNQSARVWVEESAQVLLHDGLGTNATVRLQDAVITLLDTPGNAPVDAWREKVQGDDELPGDFSITLTRDETGAAFSGKYFIVFNSADKQSGIDHYEVMEEPFAEFSAFRWGRADAPWKRTESPYVLEDQTLNSTIRVKVIDKAGNERIATLVPDVALRSMSRDILLTTLVFGGVGILLVALVVYALWRRKQGLLKEEENTPIAQD
jgi:hypothetical protein